MERKKIIQLKGIRKEFPGVVALKGFDMDIYEKEILGLVGENGAGKSTLMKILTGIYQSDGGQIILRGKPLVLHNSLEAIEQGIGMVFQEGSILPNLTVAENMFLCHEKEFSRYGIVSKSLMLAEARKVLQENGLDINPATLCSNLSPAQNQMVEISRLLWLSRLYNHENPVLILDEPTTVLLEKEINILFGILKKIKEKATVILISHRLEEIVENSDRIVVLKDGDYVTDMPQAVAGTSKIEQLMVGRDLAEGYYRRNEQVDPTQEVVLEAEDLFIEGALEPISFKLYKGEILALVGLIGSGKEELAKSLVGSVPASGGIIKRNGKQVAIKHPKHAIENRIGYIPIDRRVEGLASDLDIAENINMLVYNRLKKYGLINSKKERENAVHWMDIVRVKATSHRMKCGNLSGGNQQKVVLGKWLSADSEVLIVDHPTRGIDVGAKDEIYHHIRKLAKQGKSMIIMCDTLEEDIGLCNRMIILKDGKMVDEVFCPAEAKPTPADIIESIV
ncbi:MAG: sugar ABC transporter ATP-binding protein [Spirochaetia bacterium]|nr:sugar ABC transporter ATP-binding protein [Spirochaetia bacterium]